MIDLPDRPELPVHPRPIVVIGAGGIVRDAHLPAYRKAGFPVWAIVDLVREKAEALADTFGISRVYACVEDAVREAPLDAVYDVALMPAQHARVLELLPEDAYVLLQKPMGEDLPGAEAILAVCRRKRLAAAVNFQLRYAPFVRAARRLIDQGCLGELYDMEVRVTAFTPWDIFPRVAIHPRLEILFHSVHYLDLIRSFLGEPAGIMAKTFSHPAKTYASTRTTAILNYGHTLRGTVHTNHDHQFGPEQEESFIKWEGTKGAIKARMGLLLDYPRGVPDLFQYCIPAPGKAGAWQTVSLEGSWFPDAFIGTMSDLMRFAEGSLPVLPTRVEDAIRTMKLVESAYLSDHAGGIDPREK